MADECILIADDEADVLDTCARALSAQGYQVTGVHSGFEAVEMAKQREFDLLLTDIKMPGMSGLQAYQTIKQCNPDIVGVAITGYGAVETAIEALQVGMDDFLLKPFSLTDLRAAISKALEKKRLERENARLKALIPLYDLSRAFIAVTDLHALLQHVIQVAVQETLASLGVLMLKDETSAELEVCAVYADSRAQAPHPGYKLSDGIARRTMQDAEAVIWQAENHKESFFVRGAVNTDITTAVALPLAVKGETIGILGLAKTRKDAAFTRGDVELLSVLASNAAIAIQNARLITHIQEAYETLQELDRMKSEFVSNVSHELRAPLHTISGFVQLLLSGKIEDQPTQKECLETVYRQTQHLTGLIDDLLDVSRMESGHLELRKGSVQMHDVIQEVVGELQPLAAQRRIALTDTTTPELPVIFADAQRLGQVVRNLIDNALKFSPEDGHVTVSSEVSTDQLVIAVQDDGVGISAEAMAHLFERFYQADSSSTRRTGGTGLGLYICRQIIVAHGGTIWAESEPGKGATFRFSLPR